MEKIAVVTIIFETRYTQVFSNCLQYIHIIEINFEIVYYTHYVCLPIFYFTVNNVTMQIYSAKLTMLPFLAIIFMSECGLVILSLYFRSICNLLNIVYKRHFNKKYKDIRIQQYREIDCSYNHIYQTFLPLSDAFAIFA